MPTWFPGRFPLRWEIHTARTPIEGMKNITVTLTSKEGAVLEEALRLYAITAEEGWGERPREVNRIKKKLATGRASARAKGRAPGSSR